MPLSIKDSGGTWRTANQVYIKDSGGTWRTTKSVWIKDSGGVWRRAHFRTLDLTIATNVYSYNIKTAAINAGWNQVNPLNVNLTINAGVVVSASTTGNYALYTDTGWPAGSVIRIYNNGYIVGHGGTGGKGGAANQNGSAFAGSPGTIGGSAIYAQTYTEIYNTGVIGAGGGGGGGGGGNRNSNPPRARGGGGGGGGRSGLSNSAGGLGGDAYNGGSNLDGDPGAAGTFSGQGAGGLGGGVAPGSPTQAGPGGAGGAWGGAGVKGTNSEAVGAPGGAPGYWAVGSGNIAIVSNTGTITGTAG